MSVELNGHPWREGLFTQRLFSSSSFQLWGTVWSCPQLTVIYLFILCLAACAKRREVLCIWTPDFLSSVVLIPRKNKRRNIATGAIRAKSFHQWSSLCLHAVEYCCLRTHRSRISNSTGKNPSNQYSKIACQFILLPINCTSWGYILKMHLLLKHWNIFQCLLSSQLFMLSVWDCD